MMEKQAMKTVETPSQALKKHCITRELVKLGFTTEELRSVKFRGTNAGWAFDRWPLTWSGIPDVKALPALDLMRAYCALKWIVLEVPPWSRDRDDAWALVTATIAAPTFQIGLNTKKAQSKRAKHPRGIVTRDRKTLDQGIERLALRVHPTLSAKELWGH
jgi:hypothetical protein